MVVTREEVKHLGWLAKLEMSDVELQRYTSQIEDIISYLNKLDTIPLEEVKPLAIEKEIFRTSERCSSRISKTLCLEQYTERTAL